MIPGNGCRARQGALTIGIQPVSASYFIRYAGTVSDAEAFLEHYRNGHAAIMREYPGIRACKLHHPVEWVDPVAVNKDQVFLLAELVFDDIDALNASLQSETRQRSRADFLKFPPLDGEIRHLAIETEILFSSGVQK